MIKARADLIRTYASIVGGSAVQNDILDALKLAGGDHPQCGLDAFQSAMRKTGLATSIVQVPTLTKDVLPAIAHMAHDEFVLALGFEGDDLIL